MFVKVKIDGDLPKGSVLSHNSTSDIWQISADGSTLFGVLENTQQDSELVWWGILRFGNMTYALADRAIPDEGGFMNVLNGRVYVDNSNHSCGVVAPLPPGSPSRVAGDLVLIYLR